MSRRRTRNRISAFALSLLMFLSVLFNFGTTAFAGSSAGSSGSISGVGAKTGLKGGIADATNNVFHLSFRVGIMRSPDLYNDGTAQGRNIIANQYSHRFPDNNESIFFTPNGYGQRYTNTYVGQYDSSGRQLLEFNDADNLARVINLQADGGKPWNQGKALLSGYSFIGSANYSQLTGGKWKTIANQITTDQAMKIWSYILGPTGAANETTTYDITNRFNGMVSQYAKDVITGLPNDQYEDIGQGYLAMLMTTWKLVPAQLQNEWENAIEDYLTQKNQAKGQSPSTIVIDTATTLKFDSPTVNNKQIIMPTVDYFQYYTAVSSSWDFYNTVDLGSSAGDTYTMMQAIVNGTIADDAGTDVNRTSDHYDGNNVFSFGAAAIAYPWKRFTTASGSGRWADTSTAAAYMDVLQVGNNPFTGGAIRGFVTTGWDLPLQPPQKGIDAKGDATITFKVSPKEERIDASATTIGKKVKIEFDHSPDDFTQIALWKKLLDKPGNDNIGFKIGFTRSATPNSSTGELYSSTPTDYPNGDHIVGDFANVTGTMSRTEFLAFMSGRTIGIVDDVSGAAIAENETKKYTYTPTMYITYVLNDTPTTLVVSPTSTDIASGGVSDYASFIRPPNPPQLIKYTSKPTANAELKNGTPDNEQFDAMAGVPSNKRLYLGVGGSEFIVDVELEYKKNVDSVWRTYRSFFAGTASEFKAGDTAGPKSLGGYSVDTYNGGTYTKTWSGSVPNKAQAVTVNGSGNVTATSPAQPDRSAYNTDLAAANAYVAQVNSTDLTHTSASDRITRHWTAWGASITTNSVTDPVTTSASNSCWHSVATKTGSYQVADPCSVTASPGGPGNYTITVTFTVPAHVIDGPDSTRDMPGVEDTWKQKVNFDYMKISRVEVYKIESGRITKVDNLFGAGNSILTASIKQADPNIFTNIAQSNSGGDDVSAQSSAMGRIRYTLDGNQNDVVSYNEGVRSNKSDGLGCNGSPNSPCQGGHTNWWATGDLYTNTGYTTEKDFHRNRGGVSTAYSNQADAKDLNTVEWQKFNQRRTALNKATIISDTIILQTSSGDQSVMYFDKDTQTMQSQEQFPDVRVSKAEMWDNNSLSAANWKPEQVHIGSYNGQFQATGQGAASNQKYWGYDQVTKSFINNSGSITTAFDRTGLNAGAWESQPRPTRPNKLYIYDSKDIVPTNQNAPYTTGKAETFYKRIFSYKSANPYSDFPGVQLQPNAYNAVNQPNFGSVLGLVLDSPYSPNHTKVNDVVIHTPVSTQDATIVALPKDRDQRTAKPAGGADALIQKQNDSASAALVPPTWANMQYLLGKELANFDFENYTASTILNKTTGRYIPYTASPGVTIAPKTGFGSGKSLNAFGTRWSVNLADIGVTNARDSQILVDMDFWMPTAPVTNGTMVVSFNGYDFYIPDSSGVATWNTGRGWEKRAEGINFAGNKMHLGLQFDFGNVDNSKIFINGVEKTAYTRIAASGDPQPLIGTQLNIGSWGIDGNYPARFYVDNLKVIRKGGGTTSQDFGFSGGTQSFTAPATGDYSLEAWGAQGGGADPNGSSGSRGGSGGYSKGTVHLNAGQKLIIYVGGQGGYSGALGQGGGFNGGGNGGPGGYGGGGATDFRKSDSYGNWNIDNGMALRSGTTSQAGGYGHVAYTTAPGQGVFGPYTTVTKGRYQITVWGENLGIGIPVPYYNYGANMLQPLNVQKGYNIATYYVDVPDTITNMEWCWHQQDNGWMKIYGVEMNRLDDRVMIAGGGGGADDITGEPAGAGNDGSGGNGGGLVGGNIGWDGVSTGGYSGTQTSGGNYGYGESATTATDTGGAGGGLMGGKASNFYNGGAGGGSGFIGGVQDGVTQQSNHTGNGYARITYTPESFDASKGINGYSWADLLGPNWQNYVSPSPTTQTVTTTTMQSTVVPRQVVTSSVEPYQEQVVTTVPAGAPQGYNYIGGVQSLTAPSNGTYRLEVWGAQGGQSGSGYGGTNTGGYGGYSVGDITLTAGQVLNIYVGSYPGQSQWGGWNGGGTGGTDTSSSYRYGGGGGGASDIRLGSTLWDRVIVAGGGGGGAEYGNSGYGKGGGAQAQNGAGVSTTAPYHTGVGSSYSWGGGGGSQSQGGTGAGYYTRGGDGGFGNGGSGATGYASGNGAGGGGYFGGAAGGNDQPHGAGYSANGGGGSGYVGSLANASMQQGVRGGNGYAQITFQGGTTTTTVTKYKTVYTTTTVYDTVFIAVPVTKTVSVMGYTPDWAKIQRDFLIFPEWMSDGTCNPLMVCGPKPHGFQDLVKPSATDATGNAVQSGTFINLDYGFQVYFPNLGDFAQQPNLKGISDLTTVRGLGYNNRMDTTEWTQAKRVKFQYNVIYNGTMYRAGSWISLPVNQSYYDFYCVLANYEASGSPVEYEAVPINGRPIGNAKNDNYVSVTNKERFSDLSAYHGAYKISYVDVVGRIGNMIVSDTEDFRYSPIFKKPDGTGNWLVEGLVPTVNSSQQNKYYGDQFDIRGVAASSTGKGLNTYGTQPVFNSLPLSFPINPKDNSVNALKENFIKTGYDVLGDISTLGNYQEGVVRVLPYYYKLDLDTGSVVPLDAYLKNGEDYKPVNLYRSADGGSVPSNIYPYNLLIDWEKESARRNFTMDESAITNRMAQIHGEYVTGLITMPDGTTENGVVSTKPQTTPSGNFINIGNAQRLLLANYARTYGGTSKTYGADMNPGSKILDQDYNYEAQRWHMKFGLPASTVFVQSGQQVTKQNVDAARSGNAVILLAADVISVGNMYTLRWSQPGVASFPVTKDGKTRSFSLAGSGLPPVIALYDLKDTATIDVTSKQSH